MNFLDDLMDFGMQWILMPIVLLFTFSLPIILIGSIYSCATSKAAPQHVLNADEWDCARTGEWTHYVLVGKVTQQRTDTICIEYRHK